MFHLFIISVQHIIPRVNANVLNAQMPHGIFRHDITCSVTMMRALEDEQSPEKVIIKFCELPPAKGLKANKFGDNLNVHPQVEMVK